MLDRVSGPACTEFYCFMFFVGLFLLVLGRYVDSLIACIGEWCLFASWFTFPLGLVRPRSVCDRYVRVEFMCGWTRPACIGCGLYVRLGRLYFEFGYKLSVWLEWTSNVRVSLNYVGLHVGSLSGGQVTPVLR